LLTRKPPLREDLHFGMDLELWLHFVANGAKWVFIPDLLSEAEISGFNKTSQGSDRQADEMLKIYQEYVLDRAGLARWYRKLIFPMDRWRAAQPNLFRRGVMVGVKVLFSGVMGPRYGFRMALYMSWM
jgi:hypothetical protein